MPDERKWEWKRLHWWMVGPMEIFYFILSIYIGNNDCNGKYAVHACILFYNSYRSGSLPCVNSRIKKPLLNLCQNINTVNGLTFWEFLIIFIAEEKLIIWWWHKRRELRYYLKEQSLGNKATDHKFKTRHGSQFFLGHLLQ